VQDRAQRALLLEHVRLDPMSGRCCYRDLIDLILRSQQHETVASSSHRASTHEQWWGMSARTAMAAAEPTRGLLGAEVEASTTLRSRSSTTARNSSAALRHTNRAATVATGAHGAVGGSVRSNPLRVAGLSRSCGLKPVPQPDQRCSTSGNENSANGEARPSRSNGYRNDAPKRGGQSDGQNVPSRRAWGSAAPQPPSSANSFAGASVPREMRSSSSRGLRVDGRLLSSN